MRYVTYGTYSHAPFRAGVGRILVARIRKFIMNPKK